MTSNLLEGTWQADYLMPTASSKSFDELYPNVKPSMTFDSQESRVGGMTGCNNFTGGYSTDGNAINFAENMAVTKKMCAHGLEGEQAFLESLKRIDRFAISDDGRTLNLLQGDVAVMRLVRQ